MSTERERERKGVGRSWRDERRRKRSVMSGINVGFEVTQILNLDGNVRIRDKATIS